LLEEEEDQSHNRKGKGHCPLVNLNNDNILNLKSKHHLFEKVYVFNLEM
jgi:hypothetical protein